MSKTDTKVKIKPNLGLAEPPLFRIIYINDNVTTMEFVVNSLIEYFNYNSETATSITENIHLEGSAIEVTLSARSNGYPLCVKVEAEA